MISYRAMNFINSIDDTVWEQCDNDDGFVFNSNFSLSLNNEQRSGRQIFRTKTRAQWAVAPNRGIQQELKQSVREVRDPQ